MAQPLELVPVKIGLLYDTAQRTIYGRYVGGRSDMTAMLAFAAGHDIGSDVHRMPLANVNDAIDRVRNRTISTKVVLQR